MLIDSFEIKGLGADCVKGLKPSAKREIETIPGLLRAFVGRKPPVIRLRPETYRALRAHLEIDKDTQIVYEGVPILPEFGGETNDRDREEVSEKDEGNDRSAAKGGEVLG